MTDNQQLGEDILEYLCFYKDLGVHWFHRPIQSTAENTSTTSISRTRSSTATQLEAKSAGSRFVHTRTMFDDLDRKDESLEAIREDLGDCRRCKLSLNRKHIVFGSGNPHADLMFVGEAPGADEDEQGLPFVGRAGRLLTKIIQAMDMRREDVYICNILKCRPPGNRNPESDEIIACEPFLLRQIDSIKPKVICTLGAFGSQTLLQTKEPISRLRGEFIEFRGTKLMATFHPAYLLRNPNEKRKVWEDVQKIRDYLRADSSSAGV